jgi:hypothetical protein
VPGIKDFKKVAGATEEVAKLQERLQEFFVPLTTSAIIDGILLRNIVLSTSVTQVEHRLNRVAQGWIVVRKNANVDVWQPSANLPNVFVELQATGNVTVDLWVF